MKKFLVLLVLLVLCSVVVADNLTRVSGTGNPYSLSLEAGSIYKDVSTGRMWKANSTTRGDFTEIAISVSTGLADAPFEELNVEGKIVFSVDHIEFAGATAAANLDVYLNKVTSTTTGNILNVADGVEGQMLRVLYFDETDGADTVVVTPASGDATTLSAVKNSVEYMFATPTWQINSKNH